MHGSHSPNPFIITTYTPLHSPTLLYAFRFYPHTFVRFVCPFRRLMAGVAVRALRVSQTHKQDFIGTKQLSRGSSSEFLELVAEAGQFDGGADAVHLVAGCNEDLICGNTLWLNVFVTNK